MAGVQQEGAGWAMLLFLTVASIQLIEDPLSGAMSRRGNRLQELTWAVPFSRHFVSDAYPVTLIPLTRARSIVPPNLGEEEVGKVSRRESPPVTVNPVPC